MKFVRTISVSGVLLAATAAWSPFAVAADCSARGGGIFDAKVSLLNDAGALVVIPELSGEAQFAGSLKVPDCDPDGVISGTFFLHTPFGSRIEIETVESGYNEGFGYMWIVGLATFEGEVLHYEALLEEHDWPEPHGRITMQVYDLIEVSGTTFSEVVIDIRGPVLSGSLQVVH